MKQFVLDVEKREVAGTTGSRRLRRDGFIPSVLYSKGEAAQPLAIEYRKFIHLAERAKPSQVITFHSEDKELNDKTGIVKEIQQDTVTGKVLHVDFQVLHAGESIELDITVVLQGEAPGVKEDGGVLTQHLHEVSVSCLPRNIPDNIIVDVSSLRLGDRIAIKDLELPEGVEIGEDPEETVVNVVAARAIEEETEASEEEDGEAADKASEGSEAADTKKEDS